MPLYLYQHPETEEVKEILQGMNDIHEYHRDGVKWNRIFTIPQASIDSNLDPWSAAQFDEKTGKNKGSVGDLYDRSAELSAKRADKNGGVDPIKEKFYKDYAEKRKGKQHMDKIVESQNKTYTI